ncbi:MAG: NitT/TauT family transport system permease protein [Acidobacteriota bacterium]|jgi:NitT/TauT family transport system permease protein|nr:NitT/TauT family transport system permease protein [Acidobacteriota bacterium]
MKEEKLSQKTRLLPVIVLILIVALWALLSLLNIFPESAFPTPQAVVRGFGEEIRAGRLFDDLIASVFRVSIGFLIAVALGIPLGLILGQRARGRRALLPTINFFRNLSPLAWIPFAILWFGIGDRPAIFLIFMASFFPIVLATIAAVASIPTVYFRVAENYGYRGAELLTQVTLPAIAPQVITALRITAGLAWVVVVAAEMIAGQDGLGYAVWDSRNGLRVDLLVVNMIVIGFIGVVIDRLLLLLTKLPNIRWGYER